jgi:hypothetical protein
MKKCPKCHGTRIVAHTNEELRRRHTWACQCWGCGHSWETDWRDCDSQIIAKHIEKHGVALERYYLEGAALDINASFSPGEMQDLYGRGEGWTQLTPDQRANREAVCKRASALLKEAVSTGAQMSITEALQEARLELAGQGKGG